MDTRKTANLKNLFLLKIQSSGLNSADAKKLQFAPMNPQQTRHLGHKQLMSFKIPYFDMNGKPTKFYRLRYLESTKTGFLKATDVKDQRYEQPIGTINEVYLPPLWKPSWAKFIESDTPLFITEGELKAACATLMGFPTMGLGGVWCFMSTKNEIPLLPIFFKLNLAGRKVYIVYDSDAALNPNVAAAEHMLCRELLKLGAEPYIVRLPSLENKKTGLDDYLIAQGKEEFKKLINDAALFSAAAHLYEMNKDVIYIRNPSLMIEHKTQHKMSVKTFKNEVYINRTFVDYGGEKPKTIATADAWIKWSHRAEAASFCYEPGKPHLWDGMYNMWRGLPFAPQKGNVKPWLILMEYVFKEDPENRKWFEQWCAYPLQHLGTKLFTAVVMWSILQGTGKTLIGHTLQRLYGADNSVLIRGRDLMSGNNTYAENKQFVLGEEITGEERRSTMDELKNLITNEELRINIKYVPEYTIRSCMNFYFTSNNPDAFFLDAADRRFFVHEIQGEPLPMEFYTEVYDPWYKSDAGAQALLDYFLNLDTSDFNPKARAPMTRAKEEMIEDSQSNLTRWVVELKKNPDTILNTGSAVATQNFWSTADLLAVFDPSKVTRITERAMGVELKRAQVPRAANGHGCRTINRGQPRLWLIRNVEKYVRKTPTECGELYEKEWTFGEKTKKHEAKVGKK